MTIQNPVHSTTTPNTSTTNRPTKRLMQEKAFYKLDAQGKSIRQTELIEIARGWEQQAKQSGQTYISWANTTVPVLPDVEGKITLRTFEITYGDPA